MRAQASMIELLLVIIVIVLGIAFMQSDYHDALLIEAEHYELLYRESLLNSFLAYNSMVYNESFMTLIMHYLCNKPFNLSDAVSVIEMLDYRNNSFILYAKLNNELRLYDDQPSVCLSKLTLSTVNLTTPCGDAKLIFGLWKGEVDEFC